MRKFKVEELVCLESVSKVLGDGKARCELFKVLNNKDFEGSRINTENIAKGFLWSSSPQGYDFWADIHYRVKYGAKG